MNIYRNVIEEDLNNLFKLAEQRIKEQIKNRILKQTHNKKNGRVIQTYNRNVEWSHWICWKNRRSIKISDSEYENQ